MKKRVVGFVATVAMVMMMCTSVFAADTYSVIGTVNGNWDTDWDLTDADGDGVYEYTADMKAGDYVWKVRYNHEWKDDMNWGVVGEDGVTTKNCPDISLKLDADSTVKFTFDTRGGDVTSYLPSTVIGGAGASAGDGAGTGDGAGAPGTGDTVPFAAVAAIVAMLAMGYSAVALKKTR